MHKKIAAFAFLVILTLLSAQNLFGQTLLVAVASSMRDALKEVAEEFESQSTHKVHFTFGSSGSLAHEIDGGIPYDLYMPASASFLEELSHKKRLLSDTSRLVCKGSLVIIVSKDASGRIQKLRDVANFPLVAIANPEHAPYGRAAREALQNAGVWLALQNRILYTERVVDVLEMVEKGQVQVGIGSTSLSKSPQVEYVEVEDKLYSPPEIYVAMVKGTMHKESAQAFIDFLTSDKGKSILKKHGFLVPGE
jgi:molybdate transport system substrate-binding protein